VRVVRAREGRKSSLTLLFQRREPTCERGAAFIGTLWKGRARGDLPPHGREDLLHDCIDLLENLSVVESKHEQALTLQVRAALSIVLNLTRLEMLRAVYLDDQSRLGRVEVNDVVSKRLLSIKLHVKNLLSSHSSPQTLLSVG
jgi:hypothetical protein